MTLQQFNTKSAGAKRLMKEAIELSEPTELYAAAPFQDNLFEWHFTVRGPLESDFDGGIYHGRMTFPADYPMKPPNIIILTPNGRFELNKKICLSISGYHPETWQPSWSIRTALVALIGFMPSNPGGALGGLDYPPAERKKLAKQSLNWTCKECGICMKNALKELDSTGGKRLSEWPSPPVPTTSSLDSVPVVESESATPDPSPVALVAPLPEASAPRPPSTPRHIQESSGTNLFVILPVAFVFVALFALLLTRRFMM